MVLPIVKIGASNAAVDAAAMHAARLARSAAYSNLRPSEIKASRLASAGNTPLPTPRSNVHVVNADPLHGEASVPTVAEQPQARDMVPEFAHGLQQAMQNLKRQASAAAMSEASEQVFENLQHLGSEAPQRQRTVHFDEAATAYVEAAVLHRQLTGNAALQGLRREALLRMSAPQITDQIFLFLDLRSSAALAAADLNVLRAYRPCVVRAVQTLTIDLNVLRAALHKMKEGHRLVTEAIEAARNADINEHAKEIEAINDQYAQAMEAQANTEVPLDNSDAGKTLSCLATEFVKQRKRDMIMEFFGRMLVARSAFSTVSPKKKKRDVIMESFTASPAICA